MTILVTGGAGFIGSHVAQAALDSGESVCVLDDLSLGKKDNVPAGATLVQGSILDADLVRTQARGCRAILHLAALPSVQRSIDDPVSTTNVNVRGTLNVLEAARAADAKVVFAASSSAYGDTPTLPKRETMLTQPLSPYAASKVCGEEYCKAYFASYGLPTTALRFFNVYGPRQDPNGAYAAVIPRFIQRALRGEPLTIYGDGENARDFTYVADVAAAVLSASRPGRADGRVVNIGTGASTTLNTLAREILAVTGSSSRVTHESPRVGDVRDSMADVTLAKGLLDYHVRVPLAEGLRRTIDSVREN